MPFECRNSPTSVEIADLFAEKILWTRFTFFKNQTEAECRSVSVLAELMYLPKFKSGSKKKHVLDQIHKSVSFISKNNSLKVIVHFVSKGSFFFSFLKIIFTKTAYLRVTHIFICDVTKKSVYSSSFVFVAKMTNDQ